MSAATRLFGIYVIQGIVIVIHAFLFIKIIGRRKRSKASTLLSLFYICQILAFSLNLIFVHIKINPSAFILYNIAAFSLLLSVAFLVQSLWNLYSQLKLRKIIITCLAYLLIIILLLSIPTGIQYDQTTNWRPKYSWGFLTSLYIYITLGGIAPSIFFLIKLLQKLEDQKLIKRIKIYFLGEILFYIVSLGVALLNILDNQMYTIIWAFVSLFLTILLAWFLYYGLGREFDS